MTRLEQYLEVVSKRIQNPYGIVNSAALSRLVRHDIPKLCGIIRGEKVVISDEDLKVWGHPTDEAISDAVSRGGADASDLPNF